MMRLNHGERAVRVLIVDDDPAMRLLCRISLANTSVGNLLVEEAASGEEAIDLLADHDVDCILSDLRMGAVTGIDVLAFALERCPGATRILFSGFANDASEREASARAQVHDFLEKPMTMEELEVLLRDRVVERYLRRLSHARTA